MKALTLIVFLTFITTKAQVNNNSLHTQQDTVALLLKQRFELIKKMPHGKKRLLAVRNFKTNNLRMFNQLKKMDKTFLEIKVDLEQRKLLDNYYKATVRGVPQYISSDLDNFSRTAKEKKEFIKFYEQFDNIHEKYPEIGELYKQAIYAYTHKSMMIIAKNHEVITDRLYEIDNHNDLEKFKDKYLSDTDAIGEYPYEAIKKQVSRQKQIITLEAKKQKTLEELKTLESDRKKILKKMENKNN